MSLIRCVLYRVLNLYVVGSVHYREASCECPLIEVSTVTHILVITLACMGGGYSI